MCINIYSMCHVSKIQIETQLYIKTQFKIWKTKKRFDKYNLLMTDGISTMIYSKVFV